MVKNIFAKLPHSGIEVFDKLIKTDSFTLERIVSTGQSTPPGEWYDQDRDEWVLLLSGKAGLRFEGEKEIELHPGDFLLIPSHRRHRVEWTEPTAETVWLALHYSSIGAAEKVF